MESCIKCGMDCNGYKCDMCGEEAEMHDAAHMHGADHMMPKCSGCNEAEINCSCPPMH